MTSIAARKHAEVSGWRSAEEETPRAQLYPSAWSPHIDLELLTAYLFCIARRYTLFARSTASGET